MKPILEKIYIDKSDSIHVHMAEHPYFFVPLHYHPEIEIIHIVKSCGTRIVGNSVDNFEIEDLVMVGANIPHVWKNDKEYYEEKSELTAKALVIHFDINCFGDTFFRLPEFSQISKMLQTARRGISFMGESKKRFIKSMYKVHETTRQERIVGFINMLNEMSKTNDFEVLSNIEYALPPSDEECSKINTIYDYLFKNYLREIDFVEIASLVNMSSPSLCRYFKKHTHKTITDILNEIRVRHACRLLSSNKANSKEACYMSGFNNYSHFNKQFQEIIGKTPFQYLKEFGH